MPSDIEEEEHILPPPDSFDSASIEVGYSEVLRSIVSAANASGVLVPRLVAVSKTKPVAAVLAAYACGARHFGENYVLEIVGKAPECPPDIAWHFIGHLQSNKAKLLVAGVPSLWAVESVDSIKLAGLLEKAAAAVGRGKCNDINDDEGAATPIRAQPLRVFIQVNTSGEPQKGGVEPGGAAAALASYIVESCPHLRLAGLMTIGELGKVANVFFTRLSAERDAVRSALGPPYDTPHALELSMGMSADYEAAIKEGSTSVRVGSAIFGVREKK